VYPSRYCGPRRRSHQWSSLIVVFHRWAEELWPWIARSMENLGWYTLIRNVDLVLSLGIGHIWRWLRSVSWSSRGGARTFSLLPFQKGGLAFWDELGLLLSKVQESASVSTHSDSLVSLGLLCSFLHHSVMVASSTERLILYFLSYTKAVNEPLLLLNLSLLDCEFIFHFF